MAPASQPLDLSDSARSADANARTAVYRPLGAISVVTAPRVTIASLAVEGRPLDQLPPQQTHGKAFVSHSTYFVEKLLYRAAYDVYTARLASYAPFWEHSDDPLALLYRMVVALPVPPHKRTQVAPRADPLIKGMFIGVSRTPGGSSAGNRQPAPTCSPYSAQLAAVVAEVAAQLKHADELFTFSSLYVAIDCRAKLHTDQCNVGASYQLAIGPHEGGVLVEFPPCGPAIGWPANRWNRTDGSRPHLCMPFAGRRVSLIAYTHDVSLAPEAEMQRTAARRLGFPLPTPAVAAQTLITHASRAPPLRDLYAGQAAVGELSDAIAVTSCD